MLRILSRRPLLLNYFNYSSSSVDKAKDELIFLKKEAQVSDSSTTAAFKSHSDASEQMKSKEIITKMMPACPNPVLPCKPHPVSSQKIQTNFELLSEKFEKICQLFLKNLKGNTNFDEIVGPNTSVHHLRQQYGTIVHIPGIFGGQFVLLTHPDYLQLVLNHENDLRSCFDSLDHYSKIDFKKKNLISIKEKLEQHLTTDPSIHENIHKTTNDFIEWIKKSRDKYDEVPNNFSEEINKLSLECIWSIIFTTRINIFQPVIPPEQHLFTDSIIGASSALLSCEKGFQLWRIFDTKNWIKLCDDLNEIDCILGKHICKKNNSLIEGLFTSGVSKEEINMIVREIFVVGTILSSSALIYVLKNLARNPTKQKQLFDEIIKVLPNNDSKITEETIKSIPYLNGFILESLRVNSPIKFLKRNLEQDMNLENFLIPKNTQILIANQTANLSNDFFENSRNFVPERWFNKKLKSWNGLGCFEAKLIELELSIVVVNILRNFIVEYHHGNIGSGRSSIAIPSKSLNFTFIDRL